MKKRFGSLEINGDWLLTIALLLLCVVGGIFVYSASSYTAKIDYQDEFYFLKKQLIGYAIGFCGYFVLSNFNYKRLKKWWIIFYAVGLILLALVLTPLGKEVYGAKRWIAIGPITIQPSEIARLAFVIAAAAYFSKDITRAKTFKGVLPVIAMGGGVCLLIIMQPNMSVTVCVGSVMLVMLFAVGMPMKKLIALILPIVALIPILIAIEPYRLKRLFAFLDPWSSPKGEGYQLIQSLYALGNGGLFGTGLFSSRQKLKFLPFAESDFILSIIGEETGFLGILMLLFLCAFIIMRVIKIAKNADNFFGFLLCFGIAAVFAIQIIVNALVVTGSIPPTGIPFPLVSSGNTQIITFLASFGIVNNVYKNMNKI
ncbi:MAG: putative lipid II flippase FtsW [Clostridia bacterium]|nr:putative lipid II flippase FtsW [Clostridia bacterium]